MQAKNLKEWHRLVCERDNYVCQLQISKECKGDYGFEAYFTENGVNQNVYGDHLDTQGAAPEKRLDVSNGKCVCHWCHTLRHATPDDELPKGYLSPAVDFKQINNFSEYHHPVTEKKVEQRIYYNHKEQIKQFGDAITLPNGIEVVLKGHETLCKRCKKWIAQEVTVICFKCEKKPAPNLKKEKKPIK